MRNLVRLVCLTLASALLPTTVINAQWVNSLPTSVQDSIYWIGDMEEGTLSDWTMDGWIYPGGGIFNTGEPEVEAAIEDKIVHTGAYSARATITNAYQAANGSRAIRYMRWTDRAWDDSGDYFPKESYYSAWYYFPHTYNPNKYAPWDPGDGGWWNIFQFKSDDADGESQPVWTLNVYHDDEMGQMSLYLYSKENPPFSYDQPTLIPLPVNRWMHIEAFYKASDALTPNGEIKIWQDGRLILNVTNVVTTLESEVVVWGIGNYTDHIAGGPTPGAATLYFDDCMVSTLPVHPYVNISTAVSPPTSSATEKGTTNFTISPNPVKNLLTIKQARSSHLKNVRILNALGEEQVCPIQQSQIDVSSLAPGLYFFSQNGQTNTFVKH